MTEIGSHSGDSNHGELRCDNFASGRCRSCPRLALPPDQRFAEKVAAFTALAKSQLAESTTVLPLWVPSSIFPSRGKAKMVVTGTLESPCFGILDAALLGRELLNCPLHLPVINRTLEGLKSLTPELALAPYNIEARSGELKYLILNASRDESQLMLRFVLRSTEAVSRIRKGCARLLEAIPELCSISANIQPIPHAIVEGEQEIPLAGAGMLWERYNGIDLAFSPQSFVQVTQETAEALYRYVAERAREVTPTSVLDLFCGVGGFSMHCSSFGKKVVGVELSAQAISCAERGASRNGISNATFIAESVDTFLARTELRPDLVICNPPRRGLSPQTIERLLQLSPKRILYSSCNPTTLLRDLGACRGYQLTSLAPFEMFPLTEHLEVVACLDLL